MAKKGEIHVETASGTKELHIFNPSDVSYSPLRVQTASGVGAIQLADPVDSEHPYLRLQTASGVKSPTNGLAGITNYLEDDWNDNSLTNRTSPNDGVYTHPSANEAGDTLIGRYRPQWDVNSGTLSVSGGEVVFGAAETEQLRTPTDFRVGSWKYDWQNQAQPSTGTGGNWNQYLILGGGDSYHVENYAGGSSPAFSLVANVSSYTKIISTSFISDTNVHTTEVTRDSYDNWELIDNGASIGTATGQGRMEDASVIRFYHDLDYGVDVHLDNLVVK